MPLIIFPKLPSQGGASASLELPVREVVGNLAITMKQKAMGHRFESRIKGFFSDLNTLKLIVYSYIQKIHRCSCVLSHQSIYLWTLFSTSTAAIDHSSSITHSFEFFPSHCLHLIISLSLLLLSFPSYIRSSAPCIYCFYCTKHHLRLYPLLHKTVFFEF